MGTFRVTMQIGDTQRQTWETLEAGMKGHGKTAPEVDALVARINEVLAEKTDLTTITLTERAANKYREILEDDEKKGWGLRFSEKLSGCSGFEYGLDYSEKALPDDTVFESHGVEIHVTNGMVNRLLGSEIDYIDALQNSGFKVTNPNVRSSCGCGSSHGY